MDDDIENNSIKHLISDNEKIESQRVEAENLLESELIIGVITIFTISLNAGLSLSQSAMVGLNE